MEIKKELLDELIKDYKNPEDLIGETGLLKPLTKELVAVPQVTRHADDFEIALLVRERDAPAHRILVLEVSPRQPLAKLLQPAWRAFSENRRVFSRAYPSWTACRLLSVRTNRPAATRMTKESAIWATTRTCCARRRGPPPRPFFSAGRGQFTGGRCAADVPHSRNRIHREGHCWRCLAINSRTLATSSCGIAMIVSCD